VPTSIFVEVIINIKTHARLFLCSKHRSTNTSVPFPSEQHLWGILLYFFTI